MSKEIKQSKIKKDGKTVVINKIDGAIVPNVTTNTPTPESDSQTSVIGGSTTSIPTSTPSVTQSTTTNTNGIPKTTIKNGLVPNITSQYELPQITENTSVPSIPSAPNVVVGASIPTTSKEIEKKRLRSKFGIYDQSKVKDGIIPLVTANQVNPPNIIPQIFPPDVNQYTAFTSALSSIPEPLSIFVPYTGALKDVDLGPQSLTTNGCVTAGCLSDGIVTLTNGIFDVFPRTPNAAPFAQYDVANKKYVDDVVISDTFLGLIDTINSYKNTRILYESGTAVIHSANLTFDGTTLSATALNIDNIGINGNTISNSAANTDIVMLPNGTGVISVAGTTNYETNVIADDDIPNKKYVDDAIAVENLWDRVGTTLSPFNPTDNVSISGIFTNTMGASALQGLYLDGVTNPMTTYSDAVIARIEREISGNDPGLGFIVSALNNSVTNNSVSTNSGIADIVSRVVYGLKNTVTSASNHSGNPLGFADTIYGLTNTVTRTGISTNTGSLGGFITNVGSVINVSNSMGYNNLLRSWTTTTTGLDLTVTDYSTITNAASVIKNISGLNISVASNTQGTSTVYGIHIIDAKNADTNWGIYDSSGASWALASDNQKLIFGSTQDAEIYYDNSQLIINDITTQLVNFQNNNLTTTGTISASGQANALGQTIITGNNTGYPLDLVGTTGGFGSAAQIRISSNATDATMKLGGFTMRHFTNAEEDIAVLVATSGAGQNVLYWGGGGPGNNAATSHNFYTAPTDTTVTGFNRYTIDSAGNHDFKAGTITTTGIITTNKYLVTGGGTALTMLDGDTGGSQNLFVGTDAPSNTGADNVFIGIGAAVTCTSGSNNVALGGSALNDLTEGSGNFAAGRLALSQLTTGDNNVAVGFSALNAITTQDGNTAVGAAALLSTTGTGNVAIGNNAAYSITNKNGNTMVGFGAGLYDDNAANTLVGYFAGRGSNGVSNYRDTVLIGYEAGYNNTSGDGSVNIGYRSGYSGTGANKNIFIGYSSGYQQTTEDNLLIVDNVLRADKATEVSNAIFYGVMGATPAAQSLAINVATLTNSTGTFDLDNENLTTSGTISSTNATTGQSVINSGLVVNEGGGGTNDDDFRVETTGQGNALVVDASDDQINLNVVENYQWGMGDSTKDPTTDAPDDWIQIEIAGVVKYIPVYGA